MKPSAALILALTIPACSETEPPGGQPGADTGVAGEQPAPTDSAGPAAPAAHRPEQVTDTIRIEGMPESLPLRLVRPPEDFPLPFSTYVPEDMSASFSTRDGGATMDLTAEFGGVRNERAFIHLYVFPPGTDEQVARSTALAYEAGHGVPVSQGLEPLLEAEAATRMSWALTSYRFRYQGQGGWFAGTLGVGRHEDRLFLLMRHYPAEYADGFGPRADVVAETWVWADGTRLGS